MQLGYVGLGKMGKNMVLRLLDHDVDVVAWNRSPEPREEVASKGAETLEDLSELPSHLDTPRIIWLMLPAGDVTQEKIEELLPHLQKGDILIDGGNSFYKDTLRRNQRVQDHGVHYMDVGVSGGPGGARNGACLMIGGDYEDYQRLEPFAQIMAAQNAYKHVGPTGAGHFVKMVHNGIEYGMMQAIAEGAEVLNQSEFNLDLADVFEIYNNQSVITSRLVGWAQQAFAEDQTLEMISSKINHSGEGEWTIQTAKELNVETPVISAAFQARLDSTAESGSFRDKVVSALRGQFGGHAVKKD